MKIPLFFKLTLGCVALLLGAVGLLLPVWPTTPFALLAVGCFSSTPRVQARLLQIKPLREYYEGYTTGQRVSLRTALVSLGFLWGMLLLSALAARSAAVSLLLLAVGGGVSIHIIYMAAKK